MRVGVDAAIRIVANYETLTTDDKVAGVKLYALLQAISPVPLAADEFEEGVKTEPSEVQSIWLGHDYLNIILKVKQQGKHLFHFVEDEVSVDEASGRAKVRLTLFHDVTSATQDYSKRAYLSVPLKQYMIDGVQGVDVFFSVYTYSGRLKTYILDETGLHVEEE
nr:MAG TPA: NigD-like C-terminal beta sandwich domain [Caudoviricetes sp.]